jgi:hypothetical protein
MLTGGGEDLRSTLGETVRKLHLIDDELTIYIVPERPWTEASRVIVARAPESGDLPLEAVGMVYLLEVDIAKEVLEVWQKWRPGRSPTDTDRVVAILHYADHDAYLEPADEPPAPA